MRIDPANHRPTITVGAARIFLLDRSACGCAVFRRQQAAPLGLASFLAGHEREVG
jgi:hypothetical protein